MELNDKERKKLEVIRKVISKEMTIKEATCELGLCRQQIHRLINVYKKEGESGFVHKNRGKTPSNKIDCKIIEEIQQLYLDDFYDHNYERFLEEIKDRYSISYPSLYRCLSSDDIISPLAHKETIKLYQISNEKSSFQTLNNENRFKY